MDNLIILTLQNINDHKIEESLKKDVLVYEDDNILNRISRLQFAINPSTGKKYRRHLHKNKPTEDWEEFSYESAN